MQKLDRIAMESLKPQAWVSSRGVPGAMKPLRPRDQRHENVGSTRGSRLPSRRCSSGDLSEASSCKGGRSTPSTRTPSASPRPGSLSSAADRQGTSLWTGRTPSKEIEAKRANRRLCTGEVMTNWHPTLRMFVEPRPLREITADLARGINALDFSKHASQIDNAPQETDSQSSDMPVPHMAGSPSRAMLQHRRAGGLPDSVHTAGNAGARAHSAPHRRRGEHNATKDTSTADRQLIAVFQAFAFGRTQMYWKDFFMLCRAG